MAFPSLMKLHEPAMQFKDDEAKALFVKALAVNKDPYGFAVIRYASEWATRMEKLAEGKDLSDLPAQIKFMVEYAEKTSHEADDEGITGFMYGAAVSTLAYGEALRRWHNKDTQIGNEGYRANESGGVLNPAVLSVG